MKGETHSLYDGPVITGVLTLLGEVAVQILLGPESGGEIMDHVALGALGLFDHAVKFNITRAGNSQH